MLSWIFAVTSPVVDGLGTALGVLEALLENRQVGEFLEELGVVVEGSKDRSVRLGLEGIALGVLADPPLEELQGGCLVLGTLGDGAVVPTQGRHEWLAIDARQGGDVELVRPQGLLVVGVLVGPLTVEEEVALLEGVTTRPPPSTPGTPWGCSPGRSRR